MRAIYSAVTGIRTHQTSMDIIGNNIANVNTTGFKASRASFLEVISQTLSGGTASVAPQQVGLGAGLASTDLILTSGSMQLTGRDLDMAIEGEGFFIVKTAEGQNLYTRAGNFAWDAGGNLVNPATGQRVQGWVANAAGQINMAPGAELSDIQIPKGIFAPAQATRNLVIGGNLDTMAAAPWTTGFTAYDSLGQPHPISVEFARSGGNWTWTARTAGSNTPIGTGSLTFGADGTLQNVAGNQINFTPTGGASPMAMTIDFSEMTATFASSGGSTALVRSRDGFPSGALETVSLDAAGGVWGVFANGVRKQMAQIAVATFASPNGLLKAGNSAFAESAASGTPMTGAPGTGGKGRLMVGNLEMSNVDLTTEFSNMILTQRGFQANTRIVSAADEMLQDVVNLKR